MKNGAITPQGLVQDYLQKVRQGMADRLGLKPRDYKQTLKMKTGIYMDLNGNIAMVTKINVTKVGSPKDQELKVTIDSEVFPSGSSLHDSLNEQSAKYWEYLGPL